MIRDEFDVNDPLNTGRPIFWRLDKFIEVVESFIRADELQIALEMCDKVPAWFRDPKNYPIELTNIKKILFKQCYDVFLYGNDDAEASATREFGEEQWFNQYCYPRAELITKEIVKLNEKGIEPWLFDLSSSHGNAPLGLLKSGVKFKYLGKSMNHRAAMKIKNWIGDFWQETPNQEQHKILICTEALEHAWDPGDIVRAAYKIGVEWDQIFLSTPLGCLGGGLPNWDSRPLGHVRGWSSQEFIDFATKSFPGFSWKLYKSHSQVIHGVRNA